MSPPPEEEFEDESEESERRSAGVLWPDPFDAGTDASTSDEAPSQRKWPTAPEKPFSASSRKRRSSPWLGEDVRMAPSAPSRPRRTRGQKRKGDGGNQMLAKLPRTSKSGDMDVEPSSDFSIASMEINDRWCRKMHAWHRRKDLTSSSKGETDAPH
ncbi:unnamed protein product [Durusdinium trenchii]|uniref:Uncharacterized protein n=1 Tax=Durusdinium trenchii TaxID=1381693 RepID=A0ABP0MDD0_9DINO